MKSLFRAGWSTLVLLALSMPASAQLAVPGGDWSHGTTLNVFAGAGVDSSDTSPLAGAALGWEITPAIAVEGSGYWLDRPAGMDAFGAALKLQVGLVVPHTAVPFVQAGVGLYRASFGPTVTAVPDFYRQRMTARLMAPGVTSRFTDPTFTFGGGINVFVTRHIAVRPDIEMMIVRRDAHNHFVTAVAVHMAYHFESHPMTPSRRR
jgi:hypothetical protein